MNPVFWIIVLICAVVLWVISRPLWESFGDWLLNHHDKINDTLNKVDENDSGEKGEE